MDNFTSEFTTIQVEYILQVIAYKLIEFIQSNLDEYFDFSIRGMESQKQHLTISSILSIFR